MSFTITLEGKSYPLAENETVLDALLRQGVKAPFSCHAGICHTCMMRVLKGEPTPDSQKGLSLSRMEQGYFLPCSCTPEQDLQIAFPDTNAISVDTKVVSVLHLNREVARLRLQRPDGFSYRAGQYTVLYNPEGVGRNYSFASVPQLDADLEFHVHRLPDGHISRWIADQLKPGDRIRLGEAVGDCYYLNDRPLQPILMIGTGTGLAPLYGILRDALALRHRGDIYLYHGSGHGNGLYYQDELRQLASRHPTFKYVACLSGGATEAEVVSGRASDIALAEHPNLSGWRVYLCGSPEMVNATQLAAFLAGASMRDIHKDAFILGSKSG